MEPEAIDKRISNDAYYYPGGNQKEGPLAVVRYATHRPPEIPKNYHTTELNRLELPNGITTGEGDDAADDPSVSIV